MTYTRFTPTGQRVCVIKVYSYENQNPCGVVENPSFDVPQAFGSLTELLLLMESVFDSIGNPQRSMESRGIPGQLRAMPVTANRSWAGEPAATFTVDVMFRHNASWQGSFVWAEKKRDTTFRSALEFIAILDGALDSAAIAAVS